MYKYYFIFYKIYFIFLSILFNLMEKSQKMAYSIK